jgi:hypothetical protein
VVKVAEQSYAAVPASIKAAQTHRNALWKKSGLNRKTLIHPHLGVVTPDCIYIYIPFGALGIQCSIHPFVA